MQQGVNVEALLEHFHAIGGTICLDAELRHPGQEWIFIAAKPHAERMTLEICRGFNARISTAGQQQAGALERLRNIDQRHALFAGGERGGHPVHHHIGTAAGNHLRRGNIRAAGLNGDIETGILIKALVLGDIITSKLRLCHPFELECHLFGGMGAGGCQRG